MATDRDTRVTIAAREPRNKLITIDSPGVAPMPTAIDGRSPQVSDGFHSAADLAAGKSKRQHRGTDWMFRCKKANQPPSHPWQSKWYEVPRGAPTPALAVWPGRVIAAGIIRTGGVVFIDHGGGLATAYNHLRGVLVGDVELSSDGANLTDRIALRGGKCEIRIGDDVPAGYPVGIVGGSPVGYGLVHLHLDVATGTDVKRSTLARGRLSGTFVDPGKRVTGWRVLSYEQAWGDVGRVASIG
jgi:hypothetical protein